MGLGQGQELGIVWLFLGCRREFRAQFQVLDVPDDIMVPQSFLCWDSFTHSPMFPIPAVWLWIRTRSPIMVSSAGWEFLIRLSIDGICSCLGVSDVSRPEFALQLLFRGLSR